jgi:hypothetical protein
VNAIGFASTWGWDRVHLPDVASLDRAIFCSSLRSRSLCSLVGVTSARGSYKTTITGQLSDSVVHLTRVRAIALSFFSALRPKFAVEPPFIVLRAVNLRAKERMGHAQLDAFGVVLEKRGDGLWYGLGERTPIRF